MDVDCAMIDQTSHAIAQETDQICTQMMALAEHFRDSSNFREAMHCLFAVTELNPSLSISAKAHMNLGSLLMKHADNLTMAQQHLQSCVSVCDCILHYTLSNFCFHQYFFVLVAIFIAVVAYSVLFCCCR